MGTACATSLTKVEGENGAATSGSVGPDGLGARQPREWDIPPLPSCRAKSTRVRTGEQVRFKFSADTRIARLQGARSDAYA
jgi:hypothetical protein